MWHRRTHRVEAEEVELIFGGVEQLGRPPNKHANQNRSGRLRQVVEAVSPDEVCTENAQPEDNHLQGEAARLRVIKDAMVWDSADLSAGRQITLSLLVGEHDERQRLRCVNGAGSLNVGVI